MPIIEPTSLEDCIEFVQQNESDIQNGIYDVKIKPAWVSTLPKEILENLLKHSTTSKAVVAKAIHDPKQSPMLEKLGQDDEAAVRTAVAANIHTPVTTLQHLTEDYFDEVREAVAKNPNLPTHLLDELSQNKSSRIRLAVSNNPNMSLPILDRLFNDRSENVRKSILEITRKPSTTPALLTMLSKCQHQTVRATVCENPKVTESILENLARDEHEVVRQAVEKRWIKVAKNPALNPNQMQKLMQKHLPAVQVAIANNNHVTPEILTTLATHKENQVRITVASNPKTPETVLKKLSQDSSIDVRAAVAGNPHTPTDILTTLRKNPNAQVGTALGKNPTEINLRKEQHLCLGCGKSLGRITAFFGNLCRSCKP